MNLRYSEEFRAGAARCACGDALLQWRSVKQEASMVAQYNVKFSENRALSVSAETAG